MASNHGGISDAFLRALAAYFGRRGDEPVPVEAVPEEIFAAEPEFDDELAIVRAAVAGPDNESEWLVCPLDAAQLHDDAPSDSGEWIQVQPGALVSVEGWR